MKKYFLILEFIFLVILSLKTQQGNAKVLCASLPEEITDKIPFAPNNEKTDTCKKCTIFENCAWCPSGTIKDIYLFGQKLDDINVHNFCWTGNAFHLTNNTFSEENTNSKFTIECKEFPKWKQCLMNGAAVLALIVVGAVWFCCLFWTVILCCYAHHRRVGYSRIG